MGLLRFLLKPTLNNLKGNIGEWIASSFADVLPDTLILQDLLIDCGNNFTSQIDLLLINKKGLFVIEVKSFFHAKIYGNTTHTEWHYYKYGKHYKIYNPIQQNNRHIKHLKKFLNEFGDIPFFSIVAMFCEDFEVSGNAPQQTYLCKTPKIMMKTIQEIYNEQPTLWNDTQIANIYNYINSHQQQGKEARNLHKQNTTAYKNLLAFQKEQKICPYCKTELVLRNGKYGEFYGCRNFPNCRYTLSK